MDGRLLCWLDASMILRSRGSVVKCSVAYNPTSHSSALITVDLVMLWFHMHAVFCPVVSSESVRW